MLTLWFSNDRKTNLFFLLFMSLNLTSKQILSLHTIRVKLRLHSFFFKVYFSNNKTQK